MENLTVVFLLGITAGLSTCMTLIGGLVLGISTKYAESHPSVSKLKKFIPHLYFNLGRIFFFTIFGFILGFLGSLIKISFFYTHIFTLLVALYMLFLGVQILNIFPNLNKFKIILPLKIFEKLDLKIINKNVYSNLNAFLLGGITFFLPCGFTQAIQLYSLSTGNPVISSLTMLVFALGTSPGLIGIGGLTSIIEGKYSGYFYKFVGIVVIIFGILNMSTSINALGLRSNLVVINSELNGVSTIEVKDGKQNVKMTQTYKGYSPNKFVIKKGIPVVWIIDSKDLYNCSASIYSEDLKISKLLNSGENVFEFTPDKTGIIKFSCTMGMYEGYFEVIE